MPKIPSNQQQISSDVSFANPSSRGAGVVGGAVANLGETLTNVSMNLLKEVKTTEARDQAYTAYDEDRLYAQDELTRLQKQYPDGYYRDENGERVKNKDNSGDKTISDVYHENVAKRYKENQMKFSTQMGQQLYIEKSGRLFADSHLKLRNEEQIMHVESYKANLGRTIERLSNEAFLVPETKYNYNNLDDIAGRISEESGRLLSPDEAKAVQAKALADITKKRFQGKMNEIQYNSRYTNDPHARNQEIGRLKLEIEGLDGASQDRNAKGLRSFSDMLTADDKVALSKSVLALSSSVSSNGKSDFNSYYMNTLSRVKAGDKSALAGARSAIPSYVNAGVLTPWDGEDRLAALTSVEKAKEVASSAAFKNASVQARYKMMAEARSYVVNSKSSVPSSGRSFTGAAAGDVTYSTLSNAHDQDMKTERKNAADFQATIAGSPQQNVDKTVNPLDVKSLKQNTSLIRAAAEEAEKGYVLRNGSIKGFRPLKSSTVDTYVNYLKGGGTDPASNEAKAGLVSTLREVYGERYYKTIIDQMIGEKGLSEKWRVVGYFTDPLTKVSYMDALTTNDAQVKTNFEAKGGDANKVNAAVNKAFGAWTKSLEQTNPGDQRTYETINGVIQFARTKTMMVYDKEGSSNLNDIAKQVFEDSLGRQVYTDKYLKTGNGIKYQPIIPKTLNNQPVTEEKFENFKQNTKSFLTPDNLQKSGIVLLDPSGKQSKFDNEFYKEVSDSAYARVKQGQVYFYYRPRLRPTEEVLLYKKDSSHPSGVSPFSMPLETWLDTTPEKIPYDTKKVINRGILVK